MLISILIIQIIGAAAIVAIELGGSVGQRQSS
jgi:hypothetical protein